MSDTPKTDVLREVVIRQYKEDELTGTGMGNILAALPDIETFEREIDGWRTKWTVAIDMAARAELDAEEQARLLGMSSEREAALRGELERLKRELANMKDQRDCAMWIIEQKEKNETSDRSDENRHNVAQTGQTHEN